MRTQLLLFLSLIFLNTNAQQSMMGIPDSAVNIPTANGVVSYSITNPLGYSNNAFINFPVAVLTGNANISNQLYFYDLDLNIPSGAIVTGVEVNHSHGGCNAGSYTIDSLFLAYNGAILGNVKRDSASASWDTIASA